MTCDIMTASEYVNEKFKAWDVHLSQAETLDILLPSHLNAAQEITIDNIEAVNIGIVRFIPTLMLRATSKSVSENGHSKSVSWDLSAIKSYYSMMCKRYGIADELSAKPHISFI